jgi:hypothetical protein
MGQAHVRQYFHLLAINSGTVFPRHRKAEFGTSLDQCIYTKDLASGMGSMGTYKRDPR